MDDLEPLRSTLRARACEVGIALLGEPNWKLSTKERLRWGTKGSLELFISGRKAGFLYDFEAGVGSDLLARIQLDLNVGLQVADETRRVAAAQRIASEAVPITPGSLGDRYLTQTRKIPRPANGWEPAVCFHVERKALVWLATTETGELRAIQLIHLTDAVQKINAAEAKARKLPGAKITRGVLAGAVVRLAGDDSVLLLAEGPETGTSAWAATGRTTWICLGTVAKAEPPPGQRVVVLADDDSRDTKSARTAAKALAEAVERWRKADRQIVVVRPWTPRRWDRSDFNDLIQHEGVGAVRARVESAVAQIIQPAVPHYPAPTLSRDEAIATGARSIRTFIERAALTYEIHAEWDSMKEEIEGMHGKRAAERRQALREGRNAMARKHGQDWGAPGWLVLVPAPAGGGKTTLTAAAICEFRDRLGCLFFATNSVANAEDVAKQIPGAVVLRGRSRPDPMSPDGKAMCWRADAAMAVAKVNLPVSQTMCDDGNEKRCAFIDLCGWQREARRMRKMEQGIFVGSHEYLCLSGPMPSPDVVVVDENCLAVMVAQIDFGLDRVLLAGSVEAIEYRPIMAKVSDALRSITGILAALRAAGITEAKHFQPVIECLRKVERQNLANDLAPDMEDAVIMDRIAQHQRSEISSVLRMLIALAAEIDKPRDQAHGVSFDPNHMVIVDRRKERQARVFVHYRKRPTFKDCIPVLVLDASGEPEIYRRLFGERLEAVEAVRCERHAHVVQIRDVTFVQSTIMGKDKKGNSLSENSVKKAERLRAQIADVANTLASKHGSLMLAVNKDAEKLIAPDLEENVVLGHYGHLRGRNDFEGCDAGMIVGRLEPPAQAMENIARALYAEDPEPLCLPGEYNKVLRGIRMRDGSAEMVEVNVHPDERVQRILELWRERESEQAADRLRLIHNREPKTLYVVCNLPLNLTVDRTVTWPEFMREATGRIHNGRQGTGRRLYGNRMVEAFQLGGGVLPLSRVELLRLYGPNGKVFVGLWGSERALRDDLGEISDKGRTRQIYIYIAESALYPVTVVRYRVEGQKRFSRALVGVPKTGLRAALEALVGPLAAFEVEGPAEPSLEPSSPKPARPSPPKSPAPPTSAGRAGVPDGADGVCFNARMGLFAVSDAGNRAALSGEVIPRLTDQNLSLFPLARRYGSSRA